jgi:hypothetical protein
MERMGARVSTLEQRRSSVLRRVVRARALRLRRRGPRADVQGAAQSESRGQHRVLDRVAEAREQGHAADRHRALGEESHARDGNPSAPSADRRWRVGRAFPARALRQGEGTGRLAPHARRAGRDHEAGPDASPGEALRQAGGARAHVRLVARGSVPRQGARSGRRSRVRARREAGRQGRPRGVLRRGAVLHGDGIAERDRDPVPSRARRLGQARSRAARRVERDPRARSREAIEMAKQWKAKL